MKTLEFHPYLGITFTSRGWPYSNTEIKTAESKLSGQPEQKVTVPTHCLAQYLHMLEAHDEWQKYKGHVKVTDDNKS
jgi:hypothetical protein